MASNPYGFISSGNKVSGTNPWSARTKKDATPETAATPKNSWDSLGSWTYAGNKTANYPTTPNYPTYQMGPDTSGGTMYANNMSGPVNVTPGAAGAGAGTPAPQNPVSWTNQPWWGGSGTGQGWTPNTQPTGSINVPTGTVTPTGSPATNYAGFGTLPAWVGTDWSVDPNPAKAGMKQNDNRAAYSAYIAAMTPYLQTQQNAMQYGQDFNEAQRRYNLDKAWQMASDQYSQGITGRQQNMAEWNAQEAARQWAMNQAYQQQRDAAEMGLAEYQTNQTVWGRNKAPNVRWMRSW